MARMEFVSSAASVGCWMAIYFAQFALVAWMWRRGGEPGRRFILVTALLFRLILLPAGLKPESSWNQMLDAQAWERFLVYDHDVWRFLWDGHLSNTGLNPYRYAPNSEALDDFAEAEPWSTVRDRLNYPGHISVYPPGAQLLFRLCAKVAPGSPLGPKLASVAADLVITALLPGQWALLYAWNPLALKAGAASGHVDSVVGLLILLAARALGRPGLAGAWLATAALVKLSPLVLSPWLWRWAGWRAVAVAALVFAAPWPPFWETREQILGGLQSFGATWEFNAPFYRAAAWAMNSRSAARVAMAVLSVAAIACLWRRKALGAQAQAAWSLCAVVLLSPSVMPWYLLWAIPVGLAGQQCGPWLFSAPMGLAMLVMVDGREPAAALILQAILILTIFAVTFPWPPAKWRA
jgi:hypothetical protein